MVPSFTEFLERNNFRMARTELGGFDGLKPSDYLKEPITSFEPIDQTGGPKTSSPVLIDMEDSDDEGSLTGTIMQSVMPTDKLRNPNGTKYHGVPRDRKLRLRTGSKNNNRTLDDILLGPFSKQQAQQGMM